jgi:hypothetical protein
MHNAAQLMTSSQAVGILSDVLTRTEQERTRLAGLLTAVRETIASERGQREVARLGDRAGRLGRAARG